MIPVIPFIVGGLVGAGIMAAVAPQSGKETRDQVTKTVSELKDTAVKANEEGGPQQVAEEFMAKGKDIANDVMANSQEAAANVSARVQDAAADISSSAEAEDLKRKIEEARARIVDQVVQNAEASRDAAAGTVVTEAVEPDEVVVESVEDVPQQVEEVIDNAYTAAQDAPAE